ncbi:MAG: hypothetical protein HC913_10930 [Microscillaceae bacterium]|nr:hypothetical protein [Microscillaceae bacterium]
MGEKVRPWATICLNRGGLVLWLWLGGLGLSGSLGQEVIDEATLRNEDGRLLDNALVQMEATAAVNDMYNFKLKRRPGSLSGFAKNTPTIPCLIFCWASISGGK